MYISDSSPKNEGYLEILCHSLYAVSYMCTCILACFVRLACWIKKLVELSTLSVLECDNILIRNYNILIKHTNFYSKGINKEQKVILCRATSSLLGDHVTSSWLIMYITVVPCSFLTGATRTEHRNAVPTRNKNK